MNEPKDKRLSISKLSLKDLGVTIDFPAFTKLSYNLESRQTRISIDIDQFLTQHATTGYKIGSAALFLKQIEQRVGFYKSWGADIQKDFERDSRQAYDFQVALECFFIFCWGSITSTMREIWIAYTLNLSREEVNFYRVKECLKAEHPKAKLAAHLDVINNSDWLKYLNGARNRVEHGQIPLSQFRPKEKRLYLADNQNVDAGSETHKKDYDPVEWPSTIFDQTRRLIDYCSSQMNTLLY